MMPRWIESPPKVDENWTSSAIEGHSDSVNAIVFSPDGQLLDFGGDKTVKLWDQITGDSWGTHMGHSKSLRLPRFFSHLMIIFSSLDPWITPSDFETRPQETRGAHLQVIRVRLPRIAAVPNHGLRGVPFHKTLILFDNLFGRFSLWNQPIIVHPPSGIFNPSFSLYWHSNYPKAAGVEFLTASA